MNNDYLALFLAAIPTIAVAWLGLKKTQVETNSSETTGTQKTLQTYIDDLREDMAAMKIQVASLTEENKKIREENANIKVKLNLAIALLEKNNIDTGGILK